MQSASVLPPGRVLLGALHLVLMALAKSLNVRVVFANVPTASTDGQVVCLPALPVESSTQFLKLVWGFLHHEAGHCRHSDFDVMAHATAEGDPLLTHLYGVLEDIRMERAHIALYPGAHRVLAELVQTLVELKFFEAPSSDDPPAHVAAGLLLKYLRWVVLNQPALEEQARLHQAALEGSLGPGVVSRLLAIGQEVVQAQSSSDAFTLARRIRSFLQEEQDKATQQQCQSPEQDATDDQSAGDGSETAAEQGAADDSQESNDATSADERSCDDLSEDPAEPSSDNGNPQSSDDQADSPAEESEEDLSEGNSTPSSVDGATQPSDDSSDDTGGAPASTSTHGTDASDGDPDEESLEGADVPADAASILSSILSGAGLREETKDLGQALADLIRTEAAQQPTRPIALPEARASRSIGRDESLLLSASRVSTRLSVDLKRYLEGQARHETASLKRGSRIDSRRLTRVAFDDPRIFTKTLPQPALNTSVICLLDASSSMIDGEPRSRIDTAREALLATMMALHALRDVEAAAASFPGIGNSLVELLVDFEERPQDVSVRFGVSAQGGTPLAEALLWASCHLAKRADERRKIILVATDGEPNDVLATRQVIASCQRARHEVYGLGIDCEDRNKLFPQFSNCEDVSMLCKAFMTLFFNVLARRRTA